MSENSEIVDEEEVLEAPSGPSGLSIVSSLIIL